MITTRLAPATLPPGQRVYAVGDIHGCADRLGAMHAAIAGDLTARPAMRPMVVHLGDLIDRGPDSAGVIATLLRPFPGGGAHPPHVVTLTGNHEDMLLSALSSGDHRLAAHWLENGGGETLASWGLSWRDGPSVWAQQIPPAHLGFLRSLSVLHRVGGYAFVHAGLRPDVPLANQTRHDLLWIREPFLSHPGTLPAVAVHGHTPENGPIVRPHRIGVDTGAVLGGALSCAVLEANTLGFLQT